MEALVLNKSARSKVDATMTLMSTNMRISKIMRMCIPSIKVEELMASAIIQYLLQVASRALGTVERKCQRFHGIWMKNIVRSWYIGLQEKRHCRVLSSELSRRWISSSGIPLSMERKNGIYYGKAKDLHWENSNVIKHIKSSFIFQKLAQYARKTISLG